MPAGVVDNLDSWIAFVRSAFLELERDLDAATLLAAQEGIEESKRFHAYEDRTRKLTDTSEAVQHRYAGDDATSGAVMRWPQPYASFVDRGTSRARAFPFVFVARDRAEVALERHAEAALAKFRAKFGG